GGAYNVGPIGTPVDDFAFDFDPSLALQSDGLAYVNAPVDYTQYSSVTLTQLPEPSTWAMMLLGFGAMGIAIRRSRKKVALPHLA
ncbi:MAG TPA: PEPxxWA-CTERM sorting domain-containing protein, partial [Bryobacteraceae bacterium]